MEMCAPCDSALVKNTANQVRHLLSENNNADIIDSLRNEVYLLNKIISEKDEQFKLIN